MTWLRVMAFIRWLLGTTPAIRVVRAGCWKMLTIDVSAVMT